MFIKEGVIIPTQEVLPYLDRNDVASLYIDVFASTAPTSFPLYSDNGETYDYEKGEYFKQLVSTHKNQGQITITLSPAEGNYIPSYRNYLFRVHHGRATSITANGKKLLQYATYDQLIHAEQDGYCIAQDKYGEVTYIKHTLAPDTEVNYSIE